MRSACDADKMPTRLLCFSDDMDGLRKVPDNIPNATCCAQHLGKPLTAFPIRSASIESFGAAQQRDAARVPRPFGFDYEFAVSTEYYASGRFDARC